VDAAYPGSSTAARFQGIDCVFCNVVTSLWVLGPQQHHSFQQQRLWCSFWQVAIPRQLDVGVAFLSPCKLHTSWPIHDFLCFAAAPAAAAVALFCSWNEFTAGFTVGALSGVAWAYACTQFLPYYS
jgi:hypothetical protein